MKVYFDVTCLIPERLSGIGVYAKNTFLELNNKNSSVLPVYKKSRLLKKKFIENHIGQKGLVFIESFQNFSSEKTILHGPDFTLLSQNPKLKKVVTVHDLAVFHEDFNDQNFKERGRQQMNHLFNRLKPDHIVVPSLAVKEELQNQWGGWDDKVTVIHHGADHIKIPPSSKFDKGSEVPFFLYVGHIENRKNISGVVKAFEKFCEKDQETRLVVVGKPGFNAENLLSQIHGSSCSSRIDLKGFVSHDELGALYERATAFLFPSFYEGFGIPILESMAMGCPVVTSDRGAMREVAGEAAYLVEPTSLESLAEALERLSGDSELRESLKIKGFERVQQFTWGAAAEKLSQVYESL